jgi:hypothetical protein
VRRLDAAVCTGVGRRGRGLFAALRVEHHIRMVDGLPQPREQVEHVRVVVEQCARVDVRAELRLRLCVDRRVEVVLPRVEEVGLNRHHLRRRRGGRG